MKSPSSNRAPPTIGPSNMPAPWMDSIYPMYLSRSSYSKELNIEYVAVSHVLLTTPPMTYAAILTYKNELILSMKSKEPIAAE